MPNEQRPLKVFLCHAHSDKNAVRDLYQRLTKDGVDAWLDKEKLLPGQVWEYEIRKAVREADVVVVCLSKQFNQAGFRQKEVRLALDTAMEKPEGEIFIIPARLEECENLESLRKWHWVDLFEEDGYEMLMRALRARADKIGVTLRIKKRRPPKKRSQEKRVFYDLKAHYECDFENTTAEIVVDFLVETLTRVMRTVSGTDNNRTVEYQTGSVDHLDPKEGKTTQHALLVHGKKVQHIDKGVLGTVEPLTTVSEMLVITVTPGIKGSHLRFDSNELPGDAFKDLVEWILADIGKGVNLQINDVGSKKTSPPKPKQFEIPTPRNRSDPLSGVLNEKDSIVGDVNISGSNNGINVDKQEISSFEIPKDVEIAPEIKKVVEENKVDSKKDERPAVLQLSEGPKRKLKISSPVGRVGLAFLSLTSILILVFSFWNPLNPKGTPTSTLEIDTMTNTQAGSLDSPATDVPQTPSSTVEPSPTLTATITSTPTPLPVAITDARGISMRLVPAGEFTMGSLADEAYNFCTTISTHIVWYGYPCRKEDYLREEPKHKVYLDRYFMDVFEVSNEEYKKCVSEGACQQPSSNGANRFSSYYDNENFLNYPVLNVNWEMAKKYCEWRGARLPTEAEWEKAARGMDERSYPWGNFGPAYELYNPDFYIDRASVNLVEFNKPTVPVTSNSKGLSPYGLHNMAGNVAEWVADWYSETYYATAPSENPLGPISGEFKVIRGGSVGTFDVRTTARDYRNPSDFDNVIGFRCAKDVP